ncbi:unnamed protein product [Caretta caretta]
MGKGAMSLCPSGPLTHPTAPPAATATMELWSQVEGVTWGPPARQGLFGNYPCAFPMCPLPPYPSTKRSRRPALASQQGLTSTSPQPLTSKGPAKGRCTTKRDLSERQRLEVRVSDIMLCASFSTQTNRVPHSTCSPRGNCMARQWSLGPSLEALTQASQEPESKQPRVCSYPPPHSTKPFQLSPSCPPAAAPGHSLWPTKQGRLLCCHIFPPVGSSYRQHLALYSPGTKV